MHMTFYLIHYNKKANEEHKMKYDMISNAGLNILHYNKNIFSSLFVKKSYIFSLINPYF